VLGGIGQGFKVAMSALDDGRYSVAAGCLGIIGGCLDASVKYVQERQAFGKKIGEFQLVQELVADMRLDLEAARLLVWRAGWMKDQGSAAGIESSLAKWYASEAAVRAALNAIQVHGGYGYAEEYNVERFLRDAKAATLYEGTTQIQKLLVGKDTTGLNAFV
jgi:alkylation response protein AidB-like acyl-CoA dehydrogenase